MELHELEIFSTIINAYGLNLTFVNPECIDSQQIDLGLRSSLYESNENYFDINSFYKEIGQNYILCFRDSFDLYFFFIDLPESVYMQNNCMFAVIGPFLTVAKEKSKIDIIIQKKGIPDSISNDIYQYYSKIPILENTEKFTNILLSITNKLFRIFYKLKYLPNEWMVSIENKWTYNESKMKKYPQIAMETIEDRYKLENQLLDAISEGNYEEVTKYLYKFRQYGQRISSKDPLRNMKNLLIIFKTLFRKAAEKGHVHPLYLDNITGNFAILIEDATTIKELDDIMNNMARKFCLIVHNHSTKNYSRHVEKCIAYIEFHYAENLSLSFFASEYNISKAYLSALFKKEVHMTLTEYIQQVRMKHAFILLNSTTFSIDEIASSCGFNNLNYFTRIFKKINGKSPTKYRQMFLT